MVTVSLLLAYIGPQFVLFSLSLSLSPSLSPSLSSVPQSSLGSCFWSCTCADDPHLPLISSCFSWPLNKVAQNSLSLERWTPRVRKSPAISKRALVIVWWSIYTHFCVQIPRTYSSLPHLGSLVRQCGQVSESKKAWVAGEECVLTKETVAARVSARRRVEKRLSLLYIYSSFAPWCVCV